ncbi:MAG: putative DNA binding domain-containing protein, partial [Candidatus Promineofilum sp.]|nr:putative DNA binding domain-containing protein [Promineifilum sp.]
PLPDGRFAPFHRYSMRQAIEEGFILDVLAHYTTYTAYWQLLKKIADDPRYDKGKASYLLRSFVELSPQAIDAKVRVMVEHFAANAASQIGGKAKAMVVTRSRLHAVRYKLAFDRTLAEQGQPWKALVAFSGAVEDGGKSYTEPGMNGGIPEAQTARTFERGEYRFLICANKFQTGFDQPLLHTMYVDKKLGGVGAVQTLSRLNRTHPDKSGTAVLDFANEADAIQAAFQPYYETTLLSAATDPDVLYDLVYRLRNRHVYEDAEVEAFAAVYFLGRKADQHRLYAILDPIVARVSALHVDEQREFRGELTDYVRLYAFLSQVLPFADPDLEKLYVFARYLRLKVTPPEEELPREVQQAIDLTSYAVRQTSDGGVGLRQGVGVVDPQRPQEPFGPSPEVLEPLSQIIAELNARYGEGTAASAAVGQVMDQLYNDSGLAASARVNTRENLFLTFRQKTIDRFGDLADSNFNLYKRITEDEEYGEYLIGLLFDQYLRTHRQAAELVRQHESKTLEFKSSLRWDLREGRKDDKVITHAVLKTIAAFLNTDGGDLLIGVADDGQVLGIAHDDLDSDDKYMRHLMQVVSNGLGDRAATLLDPRMEVVDGQTVCLVSCRRSPEPVFLKWKGMEKNAGGDFYVRSGPGSRLLKPEDVGPYVRTRLPL